MNLLCGLDSDVNINGQIFTFFTQLNIGIVVPWQGQNHIDTDWGAEKWRLLHGENYYPCNLFLGSQTLEETAAQLTANASCIYCIGRLKVENGVVCSHRPSSTLGINQHWIQACEADIFSPSPRLRL
jgi:hypothetical protein